MNSKWKGILITLGTLIAISGAILFGVFSVHDNAIAYEERVTAAQSDISVTEKKRADELPNLAAAIKAHDKTQYNTLIDLVEARKGENGTLSDEDYTELKEYIVSIVVENYPELQSSQLYKTYMLELSNIENELSSVRKAYNNAVTRYNTYIRKPLNKIFLDWTGYEPVSFQKLDFALSPDAPTDLFWDN